MNIIRQTGLVSAAENDDDAVYALPPTDEFFICMLSSPFHNHPFIFVLTHALVLVLALRPVCIPNLAPRIYKPPRHLQAGGSDLFPESNATHFSRHVTARKFCKEKRALVWAEAFFRRNLPRKPLSLSPFLLRQHFLPLASLPTIILPLRPRSPGQFMQRRAGEANFARKFPRCESSNLPSLPKSV